MTVAFIGGGNMASALIGGMLAGGHTAQSIYVYEVSQERKSWIVEKFGIRVFDSIDQNICQANCIIIAVKPQSVAGVAQQLEGKIRNQLLLSIAAGIKTADLSRWLSGYGRIIRVMPNTPALVASGVSALFAMPMVDSSERKQAELIFSTVGSVFWLEQESQMDAVTAVTGSGPGYVFYFIEALQAAAQGLGFSQQQARRLSVEVFLGAARLAQQSSEEVAQLRAQVTSKGGTTEAALSYMELQQVKQHIIVAVEEAEHRSRELAEQLGAKEK